MFRSRCRTPVLKMDTDERTAGYRLESRPWLVACTHRFLQEIPFGEGLLRRWGYRRWTRDPSFRLVYYARPLPIWVLVWTLERARLGCWALLWWLHDRGVFHLGAEEGTDFRWRDVRFGRGR